MSTKSETAVRELDRRTNDGFDVRLLWSPQTNRVFVAVEDQRRGGSFQFEPAAAKALDAFHHPFAYAPNGYNNPSQQLEHLSACRLRGEEGR